LSNSSCKPHYTVPFNPVRAASPLLTGKLFSACSLSAYYIPAVAANKMQEFIMTGGFPAPDDKEQVLDLHLI